MSSEVRVPLATPSMPGRFWAATGVLVALAVLMRSYQIDYALEADEVFSVRLASQDFSDAMMGALADRPHPPLHIALLHFWVSAFGPGEASVRALSVLFSIAFMVLFAFIVRRFASAGATLAVLAIAAVSPLFSLYGQQARPYSLVLLVSCAVLLTYLRAQESPERRSRILLWAVACSCMMFTQYLGALVIGACLLDALLRKKVEWRVILWGCFGALTIAPWMIAAFRPSLSEDTLLPGILWMEAPTLADVPWFFLQVFGTPWWVRGWWLAVLLGAAGFVILAHVRSWSTLLDHSRLWIILGAIAPLSAFGISLIAGYNIFVVRHMLPAFVALLVLLAIGLSNLRPTVLASVAMPLVIWTAAAWPIAMPSNAKPPWEAVAQEVDKLIAAESLPARGLGLWVSDPLEHYVRETAVIEHSAGDALPAGRTLLVCREFDCSAFFSAHPVRQAVERAAFDWPVARQEGQPVRILIIDVSL